MTNEVDVSERPETLKELRMQHGKTLREVATPCGVSASTVMRWEDKGKIPSDEDVATYADAIGVDIQTVQDIIGPRLVESPEDEKDWMDAVAQAEQDRLMKLLLLTLLLFLDEDAWDVLVTPDQVADRAREDREEVRDRWDDVVNSGFVVRRGKNVESDLFVLRLSFPRA